MSLGCLVVEKIVVKESQIWPHFNAMAGNPEVGKFEKNSLDDRDM